MAARPRPYQSFRCQTLDDVEHDSRLPHVSDARD
jgi:hypothetical protein